VTGPPHALLIDGMAVLVRSAKAALRMKALSYHDVETGPLMLFAGTLIRHLNERPWDYVVVAWEGIPGMNWRLDLYPPYKSARAPWAPSPGMTSDEDLAREFCTAGGLHQDWSPRFEGDDIIAAWWRELRLHLPELRIKILSSDRDLLQLCDENTIWQTWANEPHDARWVLDTWGTGPERLPLLRAIAGDPSDGIPGLPGIGPQRAIMLANRPGTPAEVINSIGESFGIEAQMHVDTWYAISNLRDPAEQYQPDPGRRGERARWHPEAHGREMRELLGKYGMARLANRMTAGKLPWPSDSV
jgi:DNA polymerase I